MIELCFPGTLHPIFSFVHIEQIKKDGGERDSSKQRDHGQTGCPTDAERFEGLAEHHYTNDFGGAAWAPSRQLIDKIR